MPFCSFLGAPHLFEEPPTDHGTSPSFDAADAQSVTGDHANRTAPLSPTCLVQSPEDLLPILQQLSRCPVITLEVDASGPDPRRSLVRSVAIGSPDTIYVIDPAAIALASLRPLLSDPNVVKLGHQLNRALAVLQAKAGIAVAAVFDIVVAEQLLRAGPPAGRPLDPRRAGFATGYNLETLQRIHAPDLPRPSEPRRSLNTLGQEALDAARDRSRIVFRVAASQQALLREREMLAVRDLEMRLLPILVDAHLHGIRFDTDAWSAHQARNVPFPRRRGETSQDLSAFVHPDTGRVHPDFFQIGNPNGGITITRPKLEDPGYWLGQEVSAMYYVPAGRRIVYVSMRASDLNIIAALSEDPHMLSGLQQTNGDLHSYTASQLTGVPYTFFQNMRQMGRAVHTRLTEERQRAKFLNVIAFFNQNEGALARHLQVSREEAADLLSEFNAIYSTAESWSWHTGRRIMREGRMRSFLGRQRLVPGPQDPRHGQTDAGHPNLYPMVALYRNDLTKSAITFFAETGIPDTHLVTVAHDALWFDVPEEQERLALRALREAYIWATCRVGIRHAVPLDVCSGDNLANLTPVAA